MTTPSRNTPRAIIKDAMLEAKLLQESQEPNGEQYAQNIGRLTDMINVWQTQGMKLWLLSDQSITLVSGTQTYTLGPAGSTVMTRPTRVEQAYFLDASSPANSRPINIISWQEYLSLGQRTQTGALTSIFVDKGQTQVTVYAWPVPDSTAATGTLHLLLRTQVTGPISLTETMNFPVEWRLALVWGLAAEICTGQPQAVVVRCEGRAELYRRMLEDWDVEDTGTRIAPNLGQTNYAGGAFR
jgi:hypothetical protein